MPGGKKKKKEKKVEEPEPNETPAKKGKKSKKVKIDKDLPPPENWMTVKDETVYESQGNV